jgi:hypothetical protein
MGTPGYNPNMGSTIPGFGGVTASGFGPGNTLAYSRLAPAPVRGVPSLVNQFFPQEG